MNLLVADIGGTNARFAFQADNTQKLSNFSFLKCSDFTNIHDAIEFYKNDNNLNIKNHYLFLTKHQVAVVILVVG